MEISIRLNFYCQIGRIRRRGLLFVEICGNIWAAKMKERAHILISGWVQGVFFRDQTQKWATSLHLTGWVRNLKDGRVEVTAEGEKESIQDLISKLEQGPSLSRVDNVDVTWEEYKGEFRDFKITHADLF